MTAKLSLRDKLDDMQFNGRRSGESFNRFSRDARGWKLCEEPGDYRTRVVGVVGDYTKQGPGNIEIGRARKYALVLLEVVEYDSYYYPSTVLNPTIEEAHPIETTLLPPIL